MGGAVSSGRNNDDLIDNLLEADYIKTPPVERVFRAVDRAEYFLHEARADAYKDLAWKNGNLHLSAPCIYSEVMEGLCLEKGLSFLNLGSGTGYLSTMVGLILGCNGINHGVEVHADVVQYATRKLEEFKRYSGAIDEYDFCEPKFIQGNCLCLTSDCSSLYDRIYCGAACPEQYEVYMKNLLKTGGILVMPLNEQLLQIRRVSDTEWNIRPLLPVSFASLIMPSVENQEWVHPIEIEPLTLQVLCRSAIRNLLRRNIEIEHPPVKKAAPTNKAPKKKRALKRLVVPLFDSDSDSEEEPHVRLVGNSGRASFERDENNIFSFILGLGNGRSYFSAERSERGNREPSNEPHTREPETADQNMETDANESTDEGSGKNGNKPSTQTCRAVIEHRPESSNDGVQQQRENDQPEEEQSLEAINEINDVIVECLSVLRRERGGLDDGENETSGESDVPEDNRASSSGRGESRVDNKRKNKREKFDSGLGDEIIETRDSSDDSRSNAASSGEDDRSKKRNKRDSSSDNEGEARQIENEMRMYRSPYTENMKAKIQQLPLPTILKKYLNFYREF